MDDLTRLAISARDGDAAAFTAFVRASQADVWRFCARMIDAQRADDLVQDTFVRAWKSLLWFRADSQARTWLLAIAAHVVADHVRRTARRSRLLSVAGLRHQSLEADRATAEALANGDRTDELATAALLEGLDVDRRAAFVLTQVVGCGYAETAEILGIPVGTVRSRVARARDELVTELRRAVAQ